MQVLALQLDPKAHALIANKGWCGTGPHSGEEPSRCASRDEHPMAQRSSSRTRNVFGNGTGQSRHAACDARTACIARARRKVRNTASPGEERYGAGGSRSSQRRTCTTVTKTWSAHQADQALFGRVCPGGNIRRSSSQVMIENGEAAWPSRRSVVRQIFDAWLLDSRGALETPNLPARPKPGDPHV